MGIELVFDLYDNFMFPGEIRLLNRLAATISDGVIVEVGCFRGKSTIALALHAHVPVFSVDPHIPSDNYPFGDADREAWTANVARFGLSARVQPVNMRSLQAAAVWDKPISLFFLDGDHGQAAADLEAWLPHVTDGGLVATHDSNSPMVIEAVASFAESLELVEQDDLTYVYRKVAPRPPYEPYTFNGVTVLTRTNQYGPADRHAVQEAQSYPLPDFPLTTVIDAGAMLGDFAAWVKHLYPDCCVLAIEPELGNYDLTWRNTEHLDGVIAVRAALTYDPTLNYLTVDPINSGGHYLAKASDAVEGSAVIVSDKVMLEELMTGDYEYISLLKLDVEGSEMDILFHAADDTLKRVHYIVGERHVTHEKFQPVLDRLTALGFTVTDEPHEVLSKPPWNMTDRGIFTALNTRWNTDPAAIDVDPWNDVLEDVETDYADVTDAIAAATDDPARSAALTAAAQEARKRAPRKPTPRRRKR